MMRITRIIVLGLCLTCGVNGARAQEGAAGGGAAPPATAPQYSDWQASGMNGAVSAGGRDAVAAGIEILKRGGNAADAAAATILALSVTDSRSFCFGGEVPIMVYDAKTKGVTVIAGQGAAPRLATREEFVRRGGIPLKGIESAAVPAALDACLTLLDRFGTMTFAQVVAPTRQLLARPSRREPWHADFARTLETLVAAEAMAYPARTGLRRERSRARAPAGRRRVLPRARSHVASTPGRGPTAGSSATSTWRPTRRGSRIRSRPTIAVEPSTSAALWTQGPCLLQALQILDGIDLQRWAGRSEMDHATART